MAHTQTIEGVDMRRSLAAVAAASALLLGAGAGGAAVGAATQAERHEHMAPGTTPMDMGAIGMGGMGTMDMDAMHARMRASMPAGMAADCDAAHEGGGSHAGQPPAGHAEHHPTS
jgi:hypothetical protein